MLRKENARLTQNKVLNSMYAKIHSTFFPQIIFPVKSERKKKKKKTYWIIPFYGSIVIEHGMNLKTVAISFDLSLFVHISFFFFSGFYTDNITRSIQFEYLMAAENVWASRIFTTFKWFENVLKHTQKNTSYNTLCVGIVWTMGKSHIWKCKASNGGMEKMPTYCNVNPSTRLWLILFRFTCNLKFFSIHEFNTFFLHFRYK